MHENFPLAERLGRPVETDVSCACKRDFEFSLIQRGDFVKPGWWHWRCRRQDSAGNVEYGYVLAGPLGESPAPETFESDRR